MSEFKRGTRVSIGESADYPELGAWKGTVGEDGPDAEGNVLVRLDPEFCVNGPNDGGLVEVPTSSVTMLRESVRAVSIAVVSTNGGGIVFAAPTRAELNFKLASWCFRYGEDAADLDGVSARFLAGDWEGTVRAYFDDHDDEGLEIFAPEDVAFPEPESAAAA